MGHRLGLTFDAVADNIDPRAVIERILATVPTAAAGLARRHRRHRSSGVRLIMATRP